MHAYRNVMRACDVGVCLFLQAQFGQIFAAACVSCGVGYGLRWAQGMSVCPCLGFAKKFVLVFACVFSCLRLCLAGACLLYGCQDLCEAHFVSL